MKMARFLAVMFLVAMFPCLVGCAGAASDRPATVPVECVVTYNGKPLEGATVSAVGPEFSGSGVTDADGRVALTTFEEEGDGLVPGSYKFTVRKVKLTETPTSDEPGSAVDVTEEFLVPKKYSSLGTSGLTAEITEEGPKEVALTLTD